MDALKGLILVYNLEKEKYVSMEALCRKMDVTLKEISSDQYLETISALAGVSGMEILRTHYQGIAFSDEMLIFCGFTNDTLVAFLKNFRQEGIPAIPLKATLTPHNIVWNSIQLHAELKKEHEELTKKNS